jgi:hypothetical protein
MGSQRIIRRLALPLGLIVLAGTAPGSTLAAEPAAIGWTSPVTVRAQKGVTLRDADFAKRKVAVTWQVPGGGAPVVGIRTSPNAGNSFGPVAKFSAARQSAVDICGSSLEAAYARKSGANWRIQRAVGDIDGGGFATSNVAVGAGVARFPDIACAGGRVFVAWFQREGSDDRLNVSHARRADGIFGLPDDLGLDEKPFFKRSLAVAGVNDTAYVVHGLTDGKLRLNRYLVGAGPVFPVAPDVTRVIAQGTTEDAASGAVIAAAGNKVAVAWFRCNGIFAKVSNDKGLTWGPRKKLLGHQACFGDFGASQTSIAIRGERIVVTYGAVGLGSPGWMGIITTKNDFASFRDRQVTSRFQEEHLVGFVTAGSKARLAAAFDTGDRVRFRRQR